MVDITAKLFWYRSKEWCSAMADKLTDIVYTDESKETIDVINLLLLGWILLGLVVYIIGNVIATYLRKRKSSVSRSKPETPAAADDTVPCANDVQKSREDVHEIPPMVIPTCEGDDEEFSKWINGVISWIYVQRVVSPVIDSWLSALNARTRLSSTEHGILVDFRDLLHTSGPPKVTELRQNTYSRYDNTGLTCDMEFENIAFEMVVTQFKEKEKVLFPFVLQVKRLCGKVAIECIPEDVSFVAKYSEPPQVDLYPEASNDIELPQEDYQPLCDVVAEIASDALTHAIVPLRLSCFPDCPRIHPHTPEDVFEAAESEAERRLLVKIIKATNLGGNRGCLKPYCVVEMDDPPQRFETQVVEGTLSPFWDEAFTFSIKDPAELLFEIYDKDKGTPEGSFLGLGIVGVEELMRNPSQRQIIPLQSRPLEEDDVTGALTVEFLFLDRTSPVLETTRFGPPLRQEAGKSVETNSRVTAGGTVITTTTIKRTKEECSAITPEPKLNPNANPNFNLHGMEEMLHPQTPNALATNELTVEKNSTQNVTELDPLVAVDNQTPDLINDDVTVDTLARKSDQKSDLFDQIVELKFDSTMQNAAPKLDLCADHNIDSPILNNVRLVDLHAQIVDQIVDSVVQSIGQTPDMHAPIVDHKVCPLENGDITPEWHAQIDDRNVDSLVQITEGQLDSLAQNGYHKHESHSLNGVNIISDSASLVEDHKARNGSVHANGGAAVEVSPNGVQKTMSKSVPVIKPPRLPAILVEGPGLEKSGPAEDLPPIAEDCGGTNRVEKSMDGEEADLAGTALQQLGKQHTTPSSTSKSTLIIHSVQRVSMDTSGRWQEVPEPENSVPGSLDASPAHLSNSYSDPSSPAQESQEEEEEGRSRPKEKRSFMGTLRRRLSFHRGRSKSAEEQLEQSRASSRSTSTDRIRHPPTPVRMSPFKGRFLGGQLLSPAAAGSTRSSLSEASGISASSAKTYINENSTLVIETNENGIVKRYLIPNSLVHRSKWKKRGTKLHIYNDHVFIAKHLSGSTQCQVCRRHLTRRPGKQGYECRGCDLQCHKSCHVKVENYCSNSSINSMEVEYIHDPKGASPKSI